MAEGTWEPAFDEVVGFLDAQVSGDGERRSSMRVPPRPARGRRMERRRRSRGDPVAFGQPGAVVLDDQGGDVDRPARLRRPEPRRLRRSRRRPLAGVRAAGKDAITVRQVLCHEAGMYDVASFLERPEQILDWDAMVTGLEGMTPAFEPGTKNGYHAVTFGFIVGEIVRRVSGLGITDFVRTQIAEPLGLDGCYVGLPRAEHGRLVETITSPDAGQLTRDPAAMVRIAEQLGLTIRPELIAAALPPAILTGPGGDEWVEQPMPSGNGCFTARSLARMYVCLAGGGELDGVRLVSEKTVARAIEPQNDRPDLILGFPMQWRLGYHGVLTSAAVLPRGFGHNGYGGSGAWGDPDRELAVVYTLNALGNAIRGRYALHGHRRGRRPRHRGLTLRRQVTGVTSPSPAKGGMMREWRPI